ncbi:hypothetical protein ACIA49_01315 [Kribbella sp. NPDC051587]|uniref:hypothetical protein n=1 Tax=Kribbella sp. NPDC051587 TaxID=3364119 RepID=UPI00378911DA
MTSEKEASTQLAAAALLLGWNVSKNPHQPPVRLDLTAAIDEMLEWLGDTRRLDLGNHRSGWASIIRELLSAVDRTGSELLDLLNEELARVRQECDRGLEAIVRNRNQLRQALVHLRARLAERSALVAAWNDFLSAVRGAGTPFEDCVAARSLFWNVAHIGGLDRGELSYHLRGILDNDGRSIASSRFALRELAEEDIRGVPRDAGLSVQERLDLAGRVLLDSGEVHHHVVWHVYTRASIDGFQTTIGDLTIYSGPWLMSFAELDEIPPWVDLPPELQEWNLPWRKALLPADDDYVFTRLDLGRRQLGNAPELAGQLVDAVVTLAKHRVGRRNNWTRLAGHWHVVDDHRSGMSIGRGESLPRVDVAPHLDAVIDELQEVLVGIDVSRFAESSLHEWSETLQWWREASTGDDAGTVLVGVRVLELVASRVNLSAWDSYAKSYMQWAAVRRELIDSVVAEAQAGLYPSRPAELAAEIDYVALERLQTSLFTYETKHTVFDCMAAISALREIEQSCAGSILDARRVRILRRRLLEPGRSTEWVGAIKSDWELQTSRVARVRDALAHGGPTTRTSISLAANFVTDLVNNALYLAFDSALHGPDILTRHLEFRQDQTAWLRRFRSGIGLVPALFPNDEPEV